MRRPPLQRSATLLGAISVLITLMSLGIGFVLAAVFGGGGLWLGRREEHRPAIVLGYTALGLAVVAGVVWSILATQGVTYQDLEDTLRRR